MQEWMLLWGGDLQVALFFLFLVIFVGVERLWPRRTMSKNRKRVYTNSLLTVTAILTLPIVPVSIISAALWAESQSYGLMNNLSFTPPIWLAILFTFFVRAFVSYATHFLNHKVPLLWRLHRVHHMDTELDVSSTVRFHPLEMPVSGLISVPIVIAFGLPPWILLFYELFDVLVTLFTHSNTRLPRRIEQWLRYIVVTPGLHTVHHSTEPSETDSNFSAVFPIWDILFRTFRSGDAAPRQLGLREFRGDEVDSYGWLLLSPLRSAHNPNESSSQVQS